MNFRDRLVTDEEGNEFVFTVEMQRQLSRAGLPVEVAYLDQLKIEKPEKRARPERSSRQQESQPAPVSEPQDDEPASIQIDPMTGKYVGRVKWYNARKGYGFILRGAGEEIFFHRSGTAVDPEQLNEGQWILYDVEETKKGPEATDVEPYDGPLPE